MRFAIVYVPDLAAWALAFLDPVLRGRDLLVQSGGRVVARSEGLRANQSRRVDGKTLEASPTEGRANQSRRVDGKTLEASPTEGRGCIPPGWPVERALAQAPQAEVRAHPGVRVALAWDALLVELSTQTPWIEPVPDGLPGAGLAVMRLFQDADADAPAARLGVRIGIADDRSTALLAALEAAVGTVRAVPPGAGKPFRDTLPLRRLLDAGIGEATVERLFWLGFSTVGSLARLTAPQMAAQFEDGRRLHELVHGLGTQPVAAWHPPPQVAARHAAEDPLREPAEYEPVLAHLVRKTAAALDGLLAQSVTVRGWPAEAHGEAQGRMRPAAGEAASRPAANEAAPRQARRFAREPTADARVLGLLARLALVEAYGAFPNGAARNDAAVSDGGLAALEVALGGLCRPPAVQGGLWAEPRASVRKAVEEVERRFPGSALRIVERDAGAYLPEEAYQMVSAAKRP